MYKVSKTGFCKNIDHVGRLGNELVADQVDEVVNDYLPAGLLYLCFTVLFPYPSRRYSC